MGVLCNKMYKLTCSFSASLSLSLSLSLSGSLSLAHFRLTFAQVFGEEINTYDKLIAFIKEDMKYLGKCDKKVEYIQGMRGNARGGLTFGGKLTNGEKRCAF